MYTRVFIEPKRLQQIKKIRHPWIFSGAIQHIEGPEKDLDGEPVSVFCENEFLCHGYYNSRSQIAIRVLSWNKEEQIGSDFFADRLRDAYDIREKYILNKHTTACRLVFSESDGLPGFIVDKYNDSLVVQISTLGAERLKPVFVEALAKLIKPRMIYEKSSGDARRKEGLPNIHKELLYGEFTAEEMITENGTHYRVRFEEGQKTGFFLDQRDNRERVQKLSQGKRVLNMCAYTGGFSIAAILGGATWVESVDISETALTLAAKNFDSNNISADKHSEIVMDAFDYLKQCPAETYDLIVVDPPAFVKSHKDLKQGMKAYTWLNALALRALSPKGILCTSSCSGAISQQHFSNILTWSAGEAGCGIRILGKHGHPMDHPLLPNFPEAEYLKFFVCAKS
jgi:23S rRNA (cytosine1962-C5)-methyltransferase